MKHLPLDNLENALDHKFANRALLQQALNPQLLRAREPGRCRGRSCKDNEQLEFLGDAVLQLVASQELFQRFPAYQEVNFRSSVRSPGERQSPGALRPPTAHR